ncbi:MAG TPA: hypothetical protein GX711_02400, partial [Clostridia bacterium]|nr:hypothetical protein [Clostridia bacterium]
VQVAGVDEADLVKTDGEYIYQVNRGRVIIIKSYPGEKMSIAHTLNFRDSSFVPRELYIDEKYLVVVGTAHRPVPMIPEEKILPGPDIYPPPYYGENTVKALIYDLGDKSSPQFLRQVEIEGSYVSSRKIGSSLYLVANKYLNYHIMDQPSEQSGDNHLPSYLDTAGSGEFKKMDYGEIRYFPGFVTPNYLLVGGVNLDLPEKEMKLEAFLGAGENIYASLNNLYVAMTLYSWEQPLIARSKPHIISHQDRRTALYKFALQEGEIKYQARGEVPGSVLNQFSLDEYGEYFRIATTTGEVWRDDEYTSKNNLYVLDEGLEVVGRLEDLAPGETIYSVRFMGDRAYVVTFKTVDPLFVLDLQDATNPRVLGALKIPGYSDYLHPYDENYLLGFGKDAVEIPVKDGQGKIVGATAYYQGMKVALFDVRDVHNPVQLFSENIGDRGTDSELLRNHKALLFNREKNLLAFPVTVMEVTNHWQDGKGSATRYGEFAFQGAYVYNLDPVNGFQLKGRITHLEEEDYLKAGSSWYNSDLNVERILYIGDTIYTLSQGKITAHGLDRLEEKGVLNIPGTQPYQPDTTSVKGEFRTLPAE